MTGYLRNNIAFRRFTAERYSDFYKAKAFMLGEVLDSNRHEFTAGARETLLQYLSASESWLRDIERRFISTGHGISTDEDTAELLSSFADMETGVLGIMAHHPEDFPALFCESWYDMRSELQPLISQILTQQLRPDMFESFKLIGEFIIGYMNFTLFNLHEIDYILCKRERPFIYADKIDLNIMERAQVSSPVLRAEAYRRHGLLDDYAAPLRVKYHIDDKYINLVEERVAAYQKLRCSLEDCDSQYF